MTEPIEHLYDTYSVINSVLHNRTAQSLCGFERTFRREDFDNLDYRNSCGKCIAARAYELGEGPISINRKASWVEILEMAWRFIPQGRIEFNWTGYHS